MTEVSYGDSVGLVLVAAGSGTRLGGGVPKALRELAGAPMLVQALEPFAGLVQYECVVVPADLCASVRAMLGDSVAVVAGGATRQESVDAGLQALSAAAGLVLVHDAARPLVPAAVVSAVLTALTAGADAVIPVLPVVDTIKEVDADGVVMATPQRDRLRVVQTPQGFRRPVLVAAHAAGVGGAATDDAGLVERLGGRVQTVPGAVESFKITGPADWERAERLLTARTAALRSVSEAERGSLPEAGCAPAPGAGHRSVPGAVHRSVPEAGHRSVPGATR